MAPSWVPFGTVAIGGIYLQPQASLAAFELALSIQPNHAPALTGKAGVQVVFEHVGEATFGGSVKCLARGGRVVTCGATTGGDVQVSLHQVFFKSLSILGSTMGSKGDLRQVLRMFDQGRFCAVLDRALPMEGVGEAHRLLEAREAMGKVVLTV